MITDNAQPFMATIDNSLRMQTLTGPLITIQGDGGRTLLQINHDGTVIGSIEDAGEAARKFVDSIRSEIGRLA